MAGFFKKLFNRIVGKPTEEAAPVAEVQVALPAPEPEPKLVVKKASAKKPAPLVKPAAKAKAAAPPAKKTVAKPGPVKPKKAAIPPKKAKPAQIPEKPVIPAQAGIPLPTETPATKLDSRLRGNDDLRVDTVLPKVQPPRRTPKPAPIPQKPVILAKAKAQVSVETPAANLDSRLRGNDGVRVEAVEFKVPPPPVVEDAPARGGWFSRLKEGLSKSSKTISGSITAIFTKRKLDQETLQELEDTLIQADLGLAVAERIIAAVSHGRYDKEIDPEEVKQILAAEVAKVLKPVEVPFNFGAEKPFVILVVGVNGSGKTTTIGKLGSIAAAEGFKVMFAACDTFRAAAVEQLTVWGQRIGATTKSAAIGADAAGLAFDALKQAREDGTDILFIDTAGRLQNKTYLMDELDKVVRVIKKMDAAAPHAVLLVLDATTGQNALAQADIFTKVAGVTGLIMTKLDGTARGGILVAIAEKFKLPIHAIGVGESIDDLQPFDAQAFSRAIAGFED
jgi:fused signal recognition particle receptor